MAGKSSVRSPLQAQSERRLKKLLVEALKFRALRGRAPARSWSASVSLIGPTRMKNLNRRFRGKDYATDVLSFEAPKPFRSQGFLGELVICSSVLKRQAREYGHTPQTELQVLLVHGLLHLLGFDHEKGAREALNMRRWERKLLGLSRALAGGLIDRAARPRLLQRWKTC